MSYVFKQKTVEAVQFTVPMRAQVLAAVQADPQATVNGIGCFFINTQPIFFVNQIPGVDGFRDIVILTNWVVTFPRGLRKAFTDTDFNDTFQVAP